MVASIRLGILQIVAAVTFVTAAASPSVAQTSGNNAKGYINQQVNAPQQIQLDKNGVLILIRSVLFALDMSNKSGNYSILREIGAPPFAALNDSMRLSEIFRKMREDKTDLSGVLVYEPQLTLLPQAGKDGLLRMAGFFPSATSQINFEMVFAPIAGRWKVIGMSANVGPSGPVAPMMAPSAAPSLSKQLSAPNQTKSK